MSNDFDSYDMAALRSALGANFGELRQVMLDVDVAPMFLDHDDRPRIVQARDRALRKLGDWAKREPAAAAAMYERLPTPLQGLSLIESLLEAVTWASHFDLPIDLFDKPAPESPVFAAAPHLAPLVDESGLVDVANLDARPWGLHTGMYAFHYHQLLRRGYKSGMHYELIRSVLQNAKRYGLTARFALDERRLRLKSEYQEMFEKDHWFGRPLSEEDIDSLAIVGETFHGDVDGGTSWLHPYAGLSVRWTADGVLKTVEIEEFMPAPMPGDRWVFARYLHAIRDTSKQTFVHCDGAVKAYDASKYPRNQGDFRLRGKGDRYRKLFRVDGEFPATVWSELSCSWFRGNSMILEYFNGAA